MPNRTPPKLIVRAVDFRAATPEPDDPQDGRTLDGYAAVFNVDTEINSWEGAFTETLAAGAFRKTLKARTPVLQFDHGRDARTGSVPIGAFQTLEEDDSGLHVVARLFDNPVVEPIRQAIEGKAITGMSFRFEVLADVWTDTETGQRIKGDDLGDRLWSNDDPSKIRREIREVKLHEAGPVVFPQYTQTSVGVRSLWDAMPEADRDALRLLAGQTTERESYDRGEPEIEPASPPVAPEPGPRPIPEEPVRAVPEIKPVTSEVREVRKMPAPVSGPMTTEERRVRQGEIKSRLGEIDTEFAGAELPEDIRSEWTDLDTEFDTHTRAIEAADARRERLAAMAGEERHVDAPTRKTGPRGTVGRRADNVFDLSAIRNLARSFDELGPLYRDHAMRALEVASFSGSKDAERAQGQVASLLNTIDTKDGALARRILATGSPIYERAFGKAVIAMNVNGLSSEERAAMALGVDTSGGYAVPYMLDPSVILTSDGVINPLRRIARVVQIVGKEWQGLTSAGITVSRDGEATEVSDDGPAFDQPTVRTVKVQGFVPFSIEIDQDWASMRSELTMMLADAKETEEGTSFVLGTGSGTAPGGIPGSLDYATCQVDAGGTFASADLNLIEEDLAPRWRSRASWMANRSVFNRVRALGSSSDGGDLWVRLGAGLPNELIGYPTYEASAMTTTVAGTNDRALVFGDFSQFLIVDRVGMSVELVPHLFATGNNRPSGQRGIYAFWRNNSKVLVQNAFRFLGNLA